MRIFNFGSLNIDKVYKLEKFVEPEETVIADSYEETFGGKGLNQSIAISRSGSDVYHIGVIGKDGKALQEYLLDNNVNVDFMSEVDVANGHAVIQLDKEGQNCIIVNKGSNAYLDKSMIDLAMKKVLSDDIVLLQNEVSNISYILEKAHEKHAFIAINLSPIDEKLLQSNLEYVDLFILNELEAGSLAEYYEGNLKLLKNKLIEKFPKAAFLMTLGGEGSNYFKKDVDIFQKAFKVDVVDTTGAGDTYCGYFISNLGKGLQIEKCMQLASAASSLAIQKLGASSSIPYFSELENFIKNND